MIRRFFVLLALPGLTLLGVSGCSKQPALDPAVVAKHRTALLLEEEPDGAQTVLEVREAMFGAPSDTGVPHDHDGDGVADHAPEDHPADDHDHDGDGKADHAAEEHAADEHDHEHAEGEADHDHDGDGHADHAAEDHDHAHDAKKPLVEELDVVLVGSVGGVPNPSDQAMPDFPFAKNQAIFFLVDPEVAAEAEEHAHTHAPGEECAFCAAHAGDSAHAIAVVQFPGENGKPLAVDARDLFELKEKEMVVVKGKAKANSDGSIIVDATGVYVRR
ncbi:hypothetical protein [Lacipirellula sp.]|uniref:hypothetical protein n=1 Tax=Lacipirellula sp. TaxID=2691419 RepID=UPI003D10F177